MSLAAVPDHVLKRRDDPEAHAELVRRGLARDPSTVKRTRVCRERADYRYERKFVR